MAHDVVQPCPLHLALQLPRQLLHLSQMTKLAARRLCQHPASCLWGCMLLQGRSALVVLPQPASVGLLQVTYLLTCVVCLLHTLLSLDLGCDDVNVL